MNKSDFETIRNFLTQFVPLGETVKDYEVREYIGKMSKKELEQQLEELRR